MIPMISDQPQNAAWGTAAGFALWLGVHEVTPESTRSAVRAILRDHSYGSNARRIQAEIQSLANPAEVVKWIEELA
jgi:UDP:flavonoid glycosyltransferase YjiC (YdhE family)